MPCCNALLIPGSWLGLGHMQHLRQLLVILLSTVLIAVGFLSLGLAKPAHAYTIIDYAPSYYYGDDSVLVGDSSEIFVGKVLDQIGSNAVGDYKTPSDQFSVSVILAVKGKAAGTLTVNQFKEGNQPAIQPGSTYIFTISVIYTGLYYVQPSPYGYQLLTNDQTLTGKQLKTLAAGSSRVLALRTACLNEEAQANYSSRANWGNCPLPLAAWLTLKARSYTLIAIDALKAMMDTFLAMFSCFGGTCDSVAVVRSVGDVFMFLAFVWSVWSGIKGVLIFRRQSTQAVTARRALLDGLILISAALIVLYLLPYCLAYLTAKQAHGFGNFNSAWNHT
jgi:hypothetical protein